MTSSGFPDGNEMAEGLGGAEAPMGFDAFATGVDMSALEAGVAGLEAEQSHSAEAAEGQGQSLGDYNALIMGLPVVIKVVLGSTKLPLASVTKLAKGSVIKLDRKVGEPVDILVNGRLIARGEVVVLDEESSRFGVLLTQVGDVVPSKT